MTKKKQLKASTIARKEKDDPIMATVKKQQKKRAASCKSCKTNAAKKRSDDFMDGMGGVVSTGVKAVAAAGIIGAIGNAFHND